MKNDQQILELKTQIKFKKSELEKIKFVPITNCQLELWGQRYNLHASNKDTLMLLASTIRMLLINNDVLFPGQIFMISGYSTLDWLEDIKKKIQSLSYKEEESKLSALETRLHELLSTDKKVELELDSIKEQLK